MSCLSACHFWSSTDGNSKRSLGRPQTDPNRPLHLHPPALRAAIHGAPPPVPLCGGSIGVSPGKTAASARVSVPAARGAPRAAPTPWHGTARHVRRAPPAPLNRYATAPSGAAQLLRYGALKSGRREVCMGSSSLAARRSPLTPRPARAPHEQQPTNLRSRRRPSRLLPPPPPHATMVEMVRTSSPPRRATRCRHPENSLTSPYRASRLLSVPRRSTVTLRRPPGRRRGRGGRKEGRRGRRRGGEGERVEEVVCMGSSSLAASLTTPLWFEN